MKNLQPAKGSENSVHVSYLPQGMRRVLVKFEGVEVRGISYRGQAWFDLVWTSLGPSLTFPEGNDENGHSTTQGDGLYFYRSDRFHENGSKAARAKIAPMLRTEATQWASLHRTDFEASEIERLEANMDSATQAQIAAEQALSDAKSAHADARLALESFKNSLTLAV